MSLYPGTCIQQEYAHGRDEGRAHGDEDRANGLSFNAPASAFHGMNRLGRSFALGYLRGYREAVRTLRDGKWGT